MKKKPTKLSLNKETLTHVALEHVAGAGKTSCLQCSSMDKAFVCITGSVGLACSKTCPPTTHAN